MKNSIIFFFAIIFALTLSSCSKSENTRSVSPIQEVACHTVLVYEPINTSKTAIAYRVQKGDKISSIVTRHKTDPNQVGGPFLDYTKEMFLEDNPEITSSSQRSIRKDKCDPTKVDTSWYTKWNLKENDLVYLRIPARVDTIYTSGLDARWFVPEKTSRIVSIIDRSELSWVKLEPQPVRSDCGTVTQPQDGSVEKEIAPPAEPGYYPYPVKDNQFGIGSFCNFVSKNGLMVLLIVIILLIFVWLTQRQHKETREIIKNNTKDESEATRRVVSEANKSLNQTLTNLNSSIQQNNQTLDQNSKVMTGCLDMLKEISNRKGSQE